MPAEFDRALSILVQRVNQWSTNGKSNDLNMSNPWKKPFLLGSKDEYYNCLDIQYSSDLSDAEGYFVIDKNLSPDDIKIYVNNKYKENDDLLTALLLVHELTHVQQFLDEPQLIQKLSCINKEVKAFRSQWDFISIVNLEEFRSLEIRADKYRNLNPTYAALSMIFELRDSIGTFCKNRDLTCIYNSLETSLRNYITKDNYYRSQCSSN